MSDLALAAAVGVMLDEPREERKRPPGYRRKRRGKRPPDWRFRFRLLAILAVLAAMALLIILAGGCASYDFSGSRTIQRGSSQRSYFIRTVYESPSGGANVYSVDGPDGRETVTVRPVYRSTTGGPTIYSVERSGQREIVTMH